MYGDGSYQDGVMIALLPMSAEWTDVPRPHLTLVYAGTVGEVDTTAYNELGKEAMDLGISFGPQTLEALGVETFGTGVKVGALGVEERVDALVFKPTPSLLAMREAVGHWDASEFPFKPHVTIGPMGSAYNDIPYMVTFDRLYTAWGSTGFTTRLNP
jgi:2'-5' RNA ligase